MPTGETSHVQKTVATEGATITIGNGSTPTPTRYTVTFDSQGGSAVSSQTVDEGSKLTAPTAPTKSGYTFGGWYKDSACNNAWNFATDTVTANTTLYAKWNEVAKKQYTLTFNTNGGSAVANVTRDEGTVIDLSSYTSTKSGYTFDGWYSDSVLT